MDDPTTTIKGGDCITTSVGCMRYHHQQQLPVIVTEAETIAVVTAGRCQNEDNDNVGGEVIDLNELSLTTTTTISATDHVVVNIHNHCDRGDDTTATTTTTTPTTTNHDSKPKKTLLWMILPTRKEFFISLSFSVLIKSIFGGLFGIFPLLLVSMFNHSMIFLSATEAVTGRWIPIQQQFNAAIASSTVALVTIDKGISNRTSSSSSWPPPTLVALAIFTMVTLIVHPDGYTWICVHKIRDAIYFVMQSSSTCWAIAVHDYGAIISTLVALATFATIFFFIYVLHCTLKSRTDKSRQRQQNLKNHEKQKRKKRKHTNTRSHKNIGQLGRDRPAEEFHQDSTSLQSIQIANDTTDLSSELIESDGNVQHLLPPLAEDEPLESPPPTSASFNSMLLPMAKCEASQQLFESSRSRTTSSSTIDSVACSFDDQSSCSGRSTPTPIGICESVHPPFVTTPPKQSSYIGNIDALCVRGQNVSTPNRIINQNARRTHNNRRSGKKSQLTNVPKPNVTNQPPSMSPSKRWDALKPSNRITTRQHFARRTDRTEHTSCDAVPQKTTYDREPALSVMNNVVETPYMAANVDDHRLLQHNAISTPSIGYIQSGVYSSSVSDRQNSIIAVDNHKRSFALTENSDALIPFSGLNPNCQSWTGILNVVPPNETYYCPSTSFQNGTPTATQNQTHDFSLNNPSFYQTNVFSTNGRLSSSMEPSLYQEPVQDGISLPSFDLSFLQGANIDPGKSFCGFPVSSPLPMPSVDSIMMMSSTATTAPTKSPPFHNYQHHGRIPHVRENPFATSDEDDDDDQIEAELLELGGQMVGSILGC